MVDKLKVGISLILIIMRILIACMIIGFCATTVLGGVDFRTEEEIQLEHRNQVINNSLFEEAMNFGKEIVTKNEQDIVKSVSCLKIRKSKTTIKLVLIDYKGSYVDKCYMTTHIGIYALVSTNNYSLMKKNYREFSELVLEGEDLEILYEEVINNGSDTMQ